MAQQAPSTTDPSATSSVVQSNPIETGLLASESSDREKALKELDNPAKPKRGRGRPRKHPLPDSSDAPKRGRGRPPKKPKPTNVAATPVTAAADGEKKVKKPVGRPRKNPPLGDSVAAKPPPTTENTATPAADNGTELVKKKRGRPKKVQTAVEQTAGDVVKKAKHIPTSPVPEPILTETTPPPPPVKKRGRGRPPKKVAVIESETEPVRKKRGRPRKHPLPDTTTTTTNGPSAPKQSKVEPATTNEDGPSPPKRKRGRPKKVRRQPLPPKPHPQQQEQKEEKEQDEEMVPMTTESATDEAKTDTDPTPEFHLVAFDESSDEEVAVGENIVASIVSSNGVLQDKDHHDKVLSGAQQGDSSDSSYTTPDPSNNLAPIF